ncbi:hypothetical protein, partial [Bifidobacterium adolescentis]|uniref:hypothetical protein n=1 Tax=Bifidobacterium adolescentis TaxID=1680 RepID=UPI0034A3F423
VLKPPPLTHLADRNQPDHSLSGSKRQTYSTIAIRATRAARTTREPLEIQRSIGVSKLDKPGPTNPATTETIPAIAHSIPANPQSHPHFVTAKRRYG